MWEIEGIAFGYNPRLVKLSNICRGYGYIRVAIYSSDLYLDVWLINVYGLCHNKAIFWDHILSSGPLQVDNIIFGGDLNFSIGHVEYWGQNAHIDSLLDTIETLLEEHGLINIPVAHLKSTWRNLRTGEAMLALILDHFFIKERLLGNICNYRWWVGSGGLSNHSHFS